MKTEVKIFCPLGKECESIKNNAIQRCAWYAMVRGKDMNTGNEIDEWRCSMNWMPMLMIENSGMQRSTSCAVESFRNEMVKANQINQKLLLSKESKLFLGEKTIEVLE